MIYLITALHTVLKERIENYASRLEAKKRFKITIWPYHCIRGTEGHAVVPEIRDALEKWTKRTRKSVNYIYKGENIYTEMYSALAAEVEDENDPRTLMNMKLISKLKLSDRVTAIISTATPNLISSFLFAVRR